MTRLETSRLALRHLVAGDAAFILELLNEPSFLRHIGDRGVRNLADAERYIADGPASSYREHGFGLYLVEDKLSAIAMGICGLIRRPTLDDVDLGFAFLPAYWSKGYATEAARATLDQGRDDLGLERVVAITSLDNHPSIQLLERLGFTFERTLRMPGDNEDVRLFGLALADHTSRDC